ncbi:hypothetical protein Afil01_69270 [Actinorhabdospora filicis]|uniref:DUF397 domain-containing protein n=1 Tax=Actinorhabdospora filicis TaxID=1785913 RepID=A0A9W6SSK6_9ACTN|nr:DUF397 domain-containing protein [Actinorhabdospora filicis]GLZ82120.1 hypothetical protein Afil01_69270 [Actinorhabdospora filicis]
MNTSKPRFRKSSRSQGTGSNCVEIALMDEVLVRDSKLVAHAACPVLEVTPDTWRGFLANIRGDRF